jgi:hypothetical protein
MLLISGPYALGRTGHPGQLIAVAAGFVCAIRTGQLRDAVHRCQGGPDAAAVGPQARTAQMRAPGKLRKRAILDHPGL